MTPLEELSCFWEALRYDLPASGRAAQAFPANSGATMRGAVVGQMHSVETLPEAGKRLPAYGGDKHR